MREVNFHSFGCLGWGLSVGKYQMCQKCVVGFGVPHGIQDGIFINIQQPPFKNTKDEI